jgi:hypothetical protein
MSEFPAYNAPANADTATLVVARSFIQHFIEISSFISPPAGLLFATQFGSQVFFFRSLVSFSTTNRCLFIYLLVAYDQLLPS